MPRYDVELPFAGSVLLTVEADDETGAIQKAMETDMTMRIEGDCSPEIMSLEFLEQIARGNVLYAPMNRAAATLSEDAA